MQAEQLQRVKDRLLRLEESLESLQKLEQKELSKDEPDYTKLDRMERAIMRLAATEQKLLDERKMLETQHQGEQWGTVPDAWLVLGPYGILGPEDRWPPEFPGSGGGCSGPPAGLNSTLAFTCWAVL